MLYTSRERKAKVLLQPLPIPSSVRSLPPLEQASTPRLISWRSASGFASMGNPSKKMCLRDTFLRFGIGWRRTRKCVDSCTSRRETQLIVLLACGALEGRSGYAGEACLLPLSHFDGLPHLSPGEGATTVCSPSSAGKLMFLVPLGRRYDPRSRRRRNL
jgi:hypothetical protein